VSDDVLVEGLLEELLEGERTPEEVCRGQPELLPIVRERWQQMQEVAGEVEALFPTPVAEGSARPAPHAPAAVPSIPGYEVESVLGRGGMGVVYKARHLRLDRTVALKMLLAGEYAHPDQLARFLREAQVVASLRHENIVQVHDIGDFGERPYFTMEFMEGGSLALQLSGKPLPAQRAVALMITLAEAVQVAHGRGIVHRDLKPSNVLLTADGTPKIADFGLARRMRAEAAITQSGTPVGTPNYMAPEQAQGHSHAAGPAVDVYSLGAILYELITGRPPFHGSTPADTERQVISEEPIRPSRLNAGLSRDLETICLKCLEKAPQARYATAQALADDLRRYQQGEPITARPVSGPERAVRWIRRKPSLAALLVTGLVLLGLGIASAVTAWRAESGRRDEIASWTPRLERVRWLETEGRFHEAREMLQPPSTVDLGSLSRELDAARDELDLAASLERIRADRADLVNGRYVLAERLKQSDADYEDALTKAGFGTPRDDPATVAAKVAASHIRKTIVAAMDDWSACTTDASRRAWIFVVARGADPDPGGWRDRVRDASASGEQLRELADSAVVEQQSAQLLVALARRMSEAGVDSAALLKRVQQQYPGDFWACYALAGMLMETDAEGSVRYSQAALASRPDAALAHQVLGRMLANAQRLPEAVDQYREAIRLEPDFAEAMNFLGMALFDTGHVDEALSLVTKAVTLEGTSARNHMGLAYVLGKLGRSDEAIQELHRAVELDQSELWPRFNLASALQGVSRYDEAMEQFEAARKIAPNSGLVHLGIGRLLKDQGRIRDAMPELERAAAVDPELSRASAHYLLGECWRELRSPQKALVEYNRAIELYLRYEDAIQARRVVMVQLGLGEEVLQEWAEALRSAPNAVTIWKGYAELCAYLDRPDDYVQACHDLLDRFAQTNFATELEYVGRACLIRDAGAEVTAQAAAMIERAVQADPATTEAWRFPYFRAAQGLARYRQGDFEGAVASIDQDAAQVLGPFPHLVRAMAHHGAGRVAESLRSLTTAMRAFDWSPSRMNSPDDWMFHALASEAKALVMPDLDALLARQRGPRDDDERMALIAVCRSMQRTQRAASLYVDAFAFEPGSADRLGVDRRYDAACCAARAGCGDGEDAAGTSEEERAGWRERARGWLRDDLAGKRGLLNGDPNVESAALPGELESWFEDPALAGVRDEDALNRLPPAEHEAWRALWRDAEALLADARSANAGD
jgi:serine/threonine-protein kinase